MRLSTHYTVQRIWTVQLHSQAGGPLLACPHPRCTAATPLSAASARSAALTHLARHARADVLPPHLRTCQCRARGCAWHRRHRGCSGPVLLALSGDRSGRTWRLADTCTACAAAMSHTAVVPDTLLGPGLRHPAARTAAVPARPLHGPGERMRVREMLTYLAAALPRFTSPAARLLAVQCALRVSTRAYVHLPGGLLRGMRLCSRGELWEELEHARWLRRTSGGHAHVEAQLLDAAVLTQRPGRRFRARAAQWALRPDSLALPSGWAPALQITTLALASYTSGKAGSTDMEVLARLCGHSPHQTEELLDRLVTSHVLAAWQYEHETDEVFWYLSPQAAAHPTAIHR
jgi:hypothetical protein